MNTHLSAIAILAITLSLYPSCGETEEEMVGEIFSDNSPKVVQYYRGKGKRRELAREVGYYSNGITEFKKSYQNGLRQGLWTYWYSNGKKWSECEYANGVRDGEITVWYENGMKRYHGYYENDRKKGIWKFFNENEEIVKEMDYD